MEKEKFIGCKIEKIGEDKEGRAILEFRGDKEKCKEVISSLVSKKGIIIELQEED